MRQGRAKGTPAASQGEREPASLVAPSPSSLTPPSDQLIGGVTGT